MLNRLNPVLKQALSACRGGFAAVVVFSLFINVLMLTAPLYMLQIFDRVIVSRSEDTLLYLTLIAGVALLTLAALEITRTRIMVGSDCVALDWLVRLCPHLLYTWPRLGWSIVSLVLLVVRVAGRKTFVALLLLFLWRRVK